MPYKNISADYRRWATSVHNGDPDIKHAAELGNLGFILEYTRSALQEAHEIAISEGASEGDQLRVRQLAALQVRFEQLNSDPSQG